MPTTYNSPDGRFSVTEDDRETKDFQNTADENVIKIAVITIFYFSIYIALMIAGSNETNAGILKLYNLILSIFNLALYAYAVVVMLLIGKTLFAWFKQAIQRMR